MPTPNDVVWEYILSHPMHPAVVELDKAQAEFDAVFNPLADRCDLLADSPEWKAVEPLQEALNEKWRAVVALAGDKQT